MVRGIECECIQRHEINISSWAIMEEMKIYFDEQVSLGIYEELTVKEPYFIGKSEMLNIAWYADKWYKCKMCGCMWEIRYPDFPAYGFVRKFPDGIYVERGY